MVEASAEPSTSGTALEALALLAVKGRAPKTGYAREEFGQAWADVDRNGCDTRNDVLRRDLTDTTLKQGTHGCLVLSGTLADPYSATSIAFLRGEATSTAVQIDHVVALSDAWQKGAQALTLERRTALARLKGIEDRCWVRVAGHERVFAVADEDLERGFTVTDSGITVVGKGQKVPL